MQVLELNNSYCVPQQKPALCEECQVNRNIIDKYVLPQQTNIMGSSGYRSIYCLCVSLGWGCSGAGGNSR